MPPIPAPNGFHNGAAPTNNMQQQSQASGWNQISGSLSAKPTTGWLHPDESLLGDGVRFHVNYVGCVAIKESMRNLDFDKRTLLAREAICQVVHFTHYKHLQNWTPNEQLQKTDLSRMIDTRYSSPTAGSRVLLTISTEAITLMSVDNQKPVLRHEMSSISFASGGEGDTSEFIGYVAKDSENLRACHVVEVPALAPDVIATIGQAFELRYKQHIQGGATGLSNANGAMRAAPQLVSNDSKWGDETASQVSQSSMFNNRPPVMGNFPANNPRNSQHFLPQNPQLNFNRPGFEDNFVPNNPSPYFNPNFENSSAFTGHSGGLNQSMSARSEFSVMSNPGVAQANFRNSMVTPVNGMDPMPNSPQTAAQLHQKSMQSFYQQGPPVPAPRKSNPMTFTDTTQAASNLAVIMNQSRHVQSLSPTGPEPNMPRVPDRKSPKPCESAKLVPSNMPDLLSNKPGPMPSKPPSTHQVGNRTSNASSCDESLVAIPQTENVLPLNQQVWFHGPISRTESEKRLRKDGDFLVREKQAAGSDIKQYVLSGYQGGVVKHLLLVDPHGRVRTKHNIFESVGHLITHHMRNSMPIISSDSQVRLGNPVKKPSPPRPGMHATDI